MSPRLGVAGYPTPEGMDRVGAMEWLVAEAGRHGWEALEVHISRFLGADERPVEGELAQVKALAEERGIVLEPNAGRFAGLRGTDSARVREAFTRAMRAAKAVGSGYVRTTYGRLEVSTSRFNGEVPLGEHMRRVVEDLREAAIVAESEGVVLGVENHCDFTGREWSTMLDEVESRYVQAALDTGNAYTVFALPDDDISALAHRTVMFHLKDMRVVAHGDRGQVPFLAVGCVLGDGQVDVARAIRLAWSKGERGQELPLIVETGWLRPDGVRDAQAIRDVLVKSVERLQSLLNTDPELGQLSRLSSRGGHQVTEV